MIQSLYRVSFLFAFPFFLIISCTNKDEIQYKYAAALLSKGDRDSAYQILSSLSDKKTTIPDVYYDMAKIEFNSLNYENARIHSLLAINLYSKLKKTLIDTISWRNQLSNAYLFFIDLVVQQINSPMYFANDSSLAQTYDNVSSILDAAIRFDSTSSRLKTYQNFFNNKSEFISAYAFPFKPGGIQYLGKSIFEIKKAFPGVHKMQLPPLKIAGKKVPFDMSMSEGDCHRGCNNLGSLSTALIFSNYCTFFLFRHDVCISITYFPGLQFTTLGQIITPSMHLREVLLRPLSEINHCCETNQKPWPYGPMRYYSFDFENKKYLLQISTVGSKETGENDLAFENYYIRMISLALK